MAKYKLRLTRADQGELHSQGFDANGQHYLISEEGRGSISAQAREFTFHALQNYIEGQNNSNGKFPKKATLEIITK